MGEEQKDPSSQYLYLKPVIDNRVKPSYEMEKIIPTLESENIDTDSIFEASECHARWDDQETLKIIEKKVLTIILTITMLRENESNIIELAG